MYMKLMNIMCVAALFGAVTVACSPRVEKGAWDDYNVGKILVEFQENSTNLLGCKEALQHSGRTAKALCRQSALPNDYKEN